MSNDFRICVCAIFKDEAPYLAEWIAYHRALGVEHFALFDNGSTDGGSDVVLRSSFRDIVTIIDWPERPGQLTAYQHFVDHYAMEYDWIAFIDVDEFIHPLLDHNIPELLARAGDHAAMLIQWMNFGPAGHVARPSGLVLDEYTMRMPFDNPVNRHVKSIIRSDCIIRVGGCHISQLRGNPCDADGQTIANEAIQPNVCMETAVINHYYTKSWEDWRLKVQRGRATMPDDPVAQRKLEWFYEYERRATVADTRIQRFLPAIKAGISPLPARAAAPSVTESVSFPGLE